MSSSNGRRSHIEAALTEYRTKAAGTGETVRLPFRGASTILEVIDVPLDVPVLNAESFRIAPALADHPDRQVVIDDPESPEAQAIVTDLVRSAHRHAAELKESLLVDGQDTPGVITRSGKLINANSRCVLMRDLVKEGRLKPTVIRVAVLPANTTNSEELGLESVLQQQQEYKDKYTFVSKLMMIEKLHRQAEMSDKQIAASLREKPTVIAELREVLVLMNRARHLSSDPRPLSAFVRQADQQQNWLELLRQVRDIEKHLGREAANDHIRGWLLAFFSGVDSVHQLRNVRDDWVKRDLVPILEAGEGVATDIVEQVTAEPDPIVDGGDDRASEAEDLGLDLLGGPAAETTTPYQADPTVQRLLDLAIEAASSPDGEVSLGENGSAPSDEVLGTLRRGIEDGIKAVRRRTVGASKLVRPQAQVDTAITALKAASDAVDEVATEAAFYDLIPALSDRLAEAQQRLDELLTAVSKISPSDEGDSAGSDAESAL